jgi:7,8-dihydropterin-6-yl-methyl-4-(beta-D-ribofuranosyl)aminobenzene 5'-phosphate synthase
MSGRVKKVELIIIYDNEIHPPCRDLLSGNAWGFAVLLKRGKESVLFDCGWKAKLLLSNLNVLGVRPEKLDRVIVSHEHWDHAGGLPGLLEEIPAGKVYLGASFGEKFIRETAKLARVQRITGPQKISNWLYTTGELGESIREQSLLVKTGMGLVLITGCAHPGLDVILEASASLGKVNGILGGFHGFSAFESLPCLSFIVPCHCTIYKKAFFKELPDITRSGGVGYRMIL